MEKDKVSNKEYKPSVKQQALCTRVYKDIAVMVERRNQTYREFNNKTLKGYIEAGDKRLNAYVLPKDAYDPPKDDWQSNVVMTTIRDKQKKILAGFSMQVPEMETRAFGEENMIDVNRADIAKWLIRGSYTQEENSTIANFWEAWESSSRGTVVTYEGYLKTKYKQKYIKSYDITTGVIESEEREVNVDDKCVSILVPLTELFVWDFYIHNIQDQPKLSWVRYYDEDLFEYEFGHYKNADFVKTKGQHKTEAETDNFYYQNEWQGRVNGDSKIEVIRYYNRLKDEYIIIANGVLLLEAPLLWRVNGCKHFPFAKTIWEPFANKDFFYGNSFPNIMSGDYDHYNTLFNTISDKQFRSMVPPLLVGRINQDALDLEDEVLTHHTKISVEDVGQVRELAINGIGNADVMMLQLVAKNMEEKVPTIPDLVASKTNITAREMVIAEEKLRELKVLYNEMIVDLWKQKYYLRLANIQLNYPQPRTIVSPEGKEEVIYRTYIIDNAELDKKTGEMGILAVKFMPYKGMNRRKLEEELGVEEEVMKQYGINYKKVIVPPDFLDNYRFQIEIIPDSVYRQSQAKLQASLQEKLDIMMKFFPEILMSNQEEFFKDFSKSYDDNPDKYLAKMQQAQQQQAMQMGAPPGMPGEVPQQGAPQPGQPQAQPQPQ